MKTYYCVTSTYDNQGRVTAFITASKDATTKPKSSYQEEKRKDIYIDWFDSLEEAEEFVEIAIVGSWDHSH